MAKLVEQIIYDGKKIEIDTVVAKQIMLHFIENNLMVGDTLAEILQVAAKHFPNTFFRIHEATKAVYPIK